MTADLASWLLEQIAADEGHANHAHWAMQGEWFITADDKIDEFVRHNSPARVLAECQAKRAVVERLEASHHTVVDDCWYTCPAATEEREGETSCSDDPPGVCTCGRDWRVGQLLRLLAVPYADRPGYREEWKP